MGLYGMMITSASGMAAQSNQLSAVADNIANADTVGYKRASQEFSTLVLRSGTADYNSGSVQSNLRRMNGDQGILSYTSSPTDLALQGNGFFVVSAADGTMALTRAGGFAKNGNGELVNAAGFKLMAYPASGGQSPAVNSYAGLVPVNIATLGPVAQPSTRSVLAVNLPPDKPAISAANAPSANTASAQFSAMTSLVAYDNVGSAKTLDVYQTKIAANTWQVAVFDRAAAAPGGGFPYASGPLVTQVLSFDPANGNLAATPVTLDVPVPNGRTLLLDLSKSTELAGNYAVQEASINGSAPSPVDHVEVGADGTVSAIYKNGTRATVYQIPIASVPSPDRLDFSTGNVYFPTLESGGVLIGLPQTGSLGKIVSGALEKSTVDIATELTTMISSQHSYTANSKVFQTAADLMDVLINLKR